MIPSLRLPALFLGLLGCVLGAVAGLRATPLAPSAPPLPREISFTTYSLDQGLSQVEGYAMLQDRQGFFWIATGDGLNRFDGHSFLVYRNDPDQPAASLAGNRCLALAEDSAGLLWTATSGGLTSRDPATATLATYRNDPANPASLPGNNLNALAALPDASLWIGLTSDGLARRDPATGQFARFLPDPARPAATLPGSTVHALAFLPASSGQPARLWIGTDHGVACLPDPASPAQASPATARFDTYPETAADRIRALVPEPDGSALWAATDSAGLLRLDPATGHVTRLTTASTGGALPSDILYALAIDHTGDLWIGTRLGGLARRLHDTGEILSYKNDPSNPASLPADTLWSLCQDRAGSLWAGTRGGGVARADLRTRKFLARRHDPANPASLAGDVLWAIVEDPATRRLWIGTDANGLDLHDPATGAFTHYTQRPGDPTSLPANAIYALWADPPALSPASANPVNPAVPLAPLWVGTRDSGLARLDDPAAPGGKFTTYTRDPARPDSLPDNTILAIARDARGALWIGTRNNGLARLDDPAPPGKFTVFRHDPARPSSLPADEVRNFLLDRQGRLWLGTTSGLARLDDPDAPGGNFTTYRHDPARPLDTLSGDSVNHVMQDHSGQLWVSTDSGLTRLDPDTGHVTRVLRRKQGLPNDSVWSAWEDAPTGQLWITTINTFCRYDPATGAFRTYDSRDGLQRAFTTGATLQASGDGHLYIGGIEGFNYFLPADITDDPYLPPVVLTEFRKFGQPVQLRPNDIATATDLELTHRDTFIGFTFAALSFPLGEKNQYAYKLEGLSPDWIPAGPNREATFTNLQPGEYTFRVKASNHDGLWNETGVALRLHVRPPFWRTGWFIALASLTVGGLGWGAYHQRVGSIRRQNERLERQVAQRTAELSASSAEIARQNRALTDSLAYARTIQQAILPAPSRLDDLLSPDNWFILHRPKDIVSGDFHWLHQAPDGSILLAVCDCTGHGVPGACMSMIGSALLNQTIAEKNILDPAAALRELHLGIRHALRQTEAGSLAQDGMDIALIRLHPANGTLDYAGAHIPLLYATPDGQLHDIRADRASIGGRQKPGEERAFTPHRLPLPPPGQHLTLYLATDGYADQPDPARRRFGSHPLRALLATLPGQSCATQLQRLEHALETHQGNEAQRDDITLIGLRFGRAPDAAPDAAR